MQGTGLSTGRLVSTPDSADFRVLEAEWKDGACEFGFVC